MNDLLTLVPYVVFFWCCIVIAAIVECVIVHFKLLDEHREYLKRTFDYSLNIKDKF